MGRKHTLTVGMAVHTDYDGLYSTLTMLRSHHRDWIDEIIVVDNTPIGRKLPHCHDKTEVELNRDLCTKMNASRPGGKVRCIHTKNGGTAQPRNLVFAESSSDYTLCVDSHIDLAAGALEAFHEYVEAFPDNKDLLQGPLMYDNQYDVLATHMEPQWGTDFMFGVWHASQQQDKWIEIPAHGLGLFGMKTSAWPQFHHEFQQFGGEEGYIHDKVRQLGGKCVCIRDLKWNHRFTHIRGKAFRSFPWMMMANYIIGRHEMGYRWDDVLIHFRDYKKMGSDDVEEGIARAKQVYPNLGKPEDGKDFIMFSGVTHGDVIVRQTKDFVNFANVEGYDNKNTILPVIYTAADLSTNTTRAYEPVQFTEIEERQAIYPEGHPERGDTTTTGTTLPPPHLLPLAQRPPGYVDTGHPWNNLPSEHWIHKTGQTDPNAGSYKPETPMPTKATPLELPIAPATEKKHSTPMPIHPLAISAQPQRPPKVTAICMTYGRGGTKYQRLIEEAIQCFLYQTYPHKELLVINDTPGSTFRCNARDVHIINLPKRCRSLGEKLNVGVAMAEEYVAVWDDDDISLPKRLEQAMDQLQGDPSAFMFNSHRYWFWPVGAKGEGTYEGIAQPASFGYGLMTAVFRRDQAVAANLIKPLTGDYDKVFMEEVARQGLKVISPALAPAQWQYIYRWGVSSVHASSGTPNLKYAEAGDLKIIPGDWAIAPKWLQQYDQFAVQATIALDKKGKIPHVTEYV